MNSSKTYFTFLSESIFTLGFVLILLKMIDYYKYGVFTFPFGQFAMWIIAVLLMAFIKQEIYKKRNKIS